MQQVHIALVNLYSIVISWMTTNNTESIVKYGLTSNNYDMKSYGDSSLYYETFHHHVILDNLEPNQKYYYKIDNEDELVFNSPDINKKEIQFAVYGDLGVYNGDYTINWLNSIKEDVDLYWHAGDISYADDSFLHEGCITKFCYEDTWNTFMTKIQPFASYKPYMVVPGNHEADCHDPSCLTDRERREKLSNFTAYNTRFRMPSKESGSNALNMHYSFNYGSVHFISIDTETGFPGAEEETKYVLPCGGFEEQLKWLEQDLKKAHQEGADWIFVQGHHPMYQGNFTDINFQKAMEDLFYKYQVDIYFSGHIHSYERTFPVYRGIVQNYNKCNLRGNIKTNIYEKPNYTTYIMIGGAGNDEMKQDKYAKLFNISPNFKKLKESNIDGPWTAITDKTNFSAGKVTIISPNEMKFEYYRTDTNELFDSLIITK